MPKPDDELQEIPTIGQQIWLFLTSVGSYVQDRLHAKLLPDDYTASQLLTGGPWNLSLARFKELFAEWENGNVSEHAFLEFLLSRYVGIVFYDEHIEHLGLGRLIEALIPRLPYAPEDIDSVIEAIGASLLLLSQYHLDMVSGSGWLPRHQSHV